MAADKKAQYILLMRHAKPELPFGGKIYYGSTDYPLSESGCACAASLRGALAGLELEAVYSSDLERARRTAELALPKYADKVTIVPGLREIHLGEWEGKTFDEVRSSWKEIYEARGASFDSVSPPGGESFKELQKRTVPAFEKILEQSDGGNILIVAHGGVIWTLMCRYFDFELNNLFFHSMDYCGIPVLKRIEIIKANSEESEKLLCLSKYNWSADVI